MADMKQFLRELYPFVESLVGEQIGEKLKEGGRVAMDYGRSLGGKEVEGPKYAPDGGFDNTLENTWVRDTAMTLEGKKGETGEEYRKRGGRPLHPSNFGNPVRLYPRLVEDELPGPKMGSNMPRAEGPRMAPKWYGPPEEVDVGAALTGEGGVSVVPKSTPAPERGLQSRHDVGRAEAVKRALGGALDRIHADYGIKGADAMTMLHNFADSQRGRVVSEGLLNKGEDVGAEEEYRRFLKASGNANRPS